MTIVIHEQQLVGLTLQVTFVVAKLLLSIRCTDIHCIHVTYSCEYPVNIIPGSVPNMKVAKPFHGSP